MPPRAAILGCAGPVLEPAEAEFFAQADPWGFILFGRNVEDPGQLRALTSALREAVGRDAPILIDQEGGRVSRLMPPTWTAWTNASDFLAGLPTGARPEAMRLRYHVIAAELASAGIDVNCAPMVDLIQPDTHPAIAERMYGTDPAEVATLGRAVAEGLARGGVLPVLKHIPGHGRTPLDSHENLPQVDADLATLDAHDFAPFRALSDLAMGMTAHIVFPALDPHAPATLSHAAIDAIRDRIGFDGLLMTDDISMGALTGPFGLRAAAAIDAGCDVILHCNGNRSEMEAVIDAVPRLEGRALARADAALAARAGLTPVPIDIPAALQQIADLGRMVPHA